MVLAKFGVAVIFLNRKIFCVAVSAEDLYRISRHLHRYFRGIIFCGGALAAAVLAAILQIGGLHGE